MNALDLGKICEPYYVSCFAGDSSRVGSSLICSPEAIIIIIAARLHSEFEFVPNYCLARICFFSSETMVPSQDRHAVVFGCSGINGWGLVNQLLSGYPSTQSFSKITAIANRPFTADEARWPRDDRLQIITGVDLLTRNDDALVTTLTEKVPSAESVSHVYYAGNHLSPLSFPFPRENKIIEIDHD